MEIEVSKKSGVNTQALLEELQELHGQLQGATLRAVSLAGENVFILVDGDIADDVVEVITATVKSHNPNAISKSEREKADKEQKVKGAEVRAKEVPGWATWSEDDLMEWVGSNMSDAQIDALSIPADAKNLLKRQSAAIVSLARIVLALRDVQWPDLDG